MRRWLSSLLVTVLACCVWAGAPLGEVDAANTVAAQQAPRLTVSKTRVDVGDRVAFKGSLGRSARGSTVVLQRQRRGNWIKVISRRADSQGAFSIRTAVSKPGKNPYRVTTVRGPSNTVIVRAFRWLYFANFDVDTVQGSPDGVGTATIAGGSYPRSFGVDAGYTSVEQKLSYLLNRKCLRFKAFVGPSMASTWDGGVGTMSVYADGASRYSASLAYAQGQAVDLSMRGVGVIEFRVLNTGGSEYVGVYGTARVYCSF